MFPSSIYFRLLLIAFLMGVRLAHAQDAEPPDSTEYGIRNTKSPGKAAALSLLVPGLGEAYGGAWRRAKIFFASEAVTWAGFAAFRTYANYREDDFRHFAAEHAGVTLNGQSGSYFRDVGLFLNSEDFNRNQLLANRDRAVLHSGPDAWAWDSAASRETYLSIRRSSRRADNRSLYVLGFAFATRVASAIDARKLVRSRQRTEPGPSFNLLLPPDGSVWLLARVSF